MEPWLFWRLPALSRLGGWDQQGTRPGGWSGCCEPPASTRNTCGNGYVWSQLMAKVLWRSQLRASVTSARRRCGLLSITDTTYVNLFTSHKALPHKPDYRWVLSRKTITPIIKSSNSALQNMAQVEIFHVATLALKWSSAPKPHRRRHWWSQRADRPLTTCPDWTVFQSCQRIFVQ